MTSANELNAIINERKRIEEEVMKLDYTGLYPLIYREQVLKIIRNEK